MISFEIHPLITTFIFAQIELETVAEDIDGVLLPRVIFKEPVEAPSSLLSVLFHHLLLLFNLFLLFFGLFTLNVVLYEILDAFLRLLFRDVDGSALVAKCLPVLYSLLNLVANLIFAEISHMLFGLQGELFLCWRVVYNDGSGFNFGRLLHNLMKVLLLFLDMYQIARGRNQILGRNLFVDYSLLHDRELKLFELILGLLANFGFNYGGQFLYRRDLRVVRGLKVTVRDG